MLPSLTPPKGFLFSYPETLPPLIKIDKKEDLLTNQAAFIIQKTFRNFISKRNNDLKEKLIESFDSHILREDFSRLEVNRVSIIKSLIQNIFPLVLEMAYSKKPILKREKLRSFKNQTIKNIFSLLTYQKRNNEFVLALIKATPFKCDAPFDHHYGHKFKISRLENSPYKVNYYPMEYLFIRKELPIENPRKLRKDCNGESLSPVEEIQEQRAPSEKMQQHERALAEIFKDSDLYIPDCPIEILSHNEQREKILNLIAYPWFNSTLASAMIYRKVPQKIESLRDFALKNTHLIQIFIDVAHLLKTIHKQNLVYGLLSPNTILIKIDHKGILRGYLNHLDGIEPPSLTDATKLLDKKYQPRSSLWNIPFRDTYQLVIIIKEALCPEFSSLPIADPFNIQAPPFNLKEAELRAIQNAIATIFPHLFKMGFELMSRSQTSEAFEETIGWIRKNKLEQEADGLKKLWLKEKIVLGFIDDVIKQDLQLEEKMKQPYLGLDDFAQEARSTDLFLACLIRKLEILKKETIE